MEAPGSTTLVVVGEEATTAIVSLAGLANVESASFAEMPDATDAEVVTWSSTSHAPGGVFQTNGARSTVATRFTFV